ncbi:S-formylglutathione hydrolase [Psychromonas sp. Urea-02u-13]|uniref:S-formylglutathione hydrolase n=1 Tax=Psychromonas sp. Urea-02u-13 TaxID=2058326 RepID=UPI000C342DBE|nr:S-formylglutathione hydrolase [Psychromonas sp. Urea-02u-13]PKG38124.1 S-formylglutathione hydrolase [Psychromonas sp. Urea-02u-13]
MNLQNISQNKVAGGWHKQYQHDAKSVNSVMKFAIFLPPNASENNKVPVLYWLSGLTCDDQNFMQKAGAFKKAAELGIAIVTADTSPRGEDVADDENAAYDFGLGAGFYVNATQAPWNKHYQMYDYIAQELPALIEAHFPVTNKKSISGHSMGGHGALTIGLKNQADYQSISAFSPICNPINSPWGKKAFSNYLGKNQEDWRAYDACELIKEGSSLPILVDQGEADQFLEEQLKPDLLINAANKNNADLMLRMQAGYDHSYFFISSFIDDHLEFHAKNLS